MGNRTTSCLQSMSRESLNKEKRERVKDYRRLRQRAEDLLKDRSEDTSQAANPDEIIHELRVHQIELEMQNEELRKAQRTIEVSRTRYANLYDFAPVGYVTLNNKGLILAANLTLSGILGIERRLLIMKPFSHYVISTFQEVFRTHRRKVLETGRKQSCELMLKKSDGQSFYASIESVPEEAEKPVNIFSAVTDITTRKREEEKRQLLSTAIDDIAEGVAITSVGGVIEFVNPAFCHITGFSEQEILGNTMRVLRSKKGDEESKPGWDELLSDHVVSARLKKRHKDGRLIDLEVSISPVDDNSGTITHYVGVFRDITEKTRLEEQLQQSQKMEALGTLSGGIAHDFNNMLAVIIGNAEIALDDIGNAGPRRNIEHIMQASKRAADLVRQILTFSRKADKSRETLRLTPLLSETYKLLRGTLPSTVDMKLEVETESDTISGNASQMQQVIMNLATNAAHAMNGNGGILTMGLALITVTQDGYRSDPELSQGEYVKLSVKDTGVGMTDRIRRRIFDPFFTTKEPNRGTGMGLAVVYGIVKAHDGAIIVESKPGKGSIFNVFLPYLKADTKEEHEKVDAVPGGRERILFVDDEPTVTDLASQMLERLGYHVTTATSGSEAWTLFSKEPDGFDLVITDQTMPGLTGILLAERMLRVRKELPIILLTGYSEMVSAEKARAAGIAAFALKPVTKREIAATIRRVLDQRSSTGSHPQG